MGVEGKQKSSSNESDLVPTVDTVRYTFLCSLLLLGKNPVLLTGQYKAVNRKPLFWLRPC